MSSRCDVSGAREDANGERQSAARVIKGGSGGKRGGIGIVMVMGK